MYPHLQCPAHSSQKKAPPPAAGDHSVCQQSNCFEQFPHQIPSICNESANYGNVCVPELAVCLCGLRGRERWPTHFTLSRVLFAHINCKLLSPLRALLKMDRIRDSSSPVFWLTRCSPEASSDASSRVQGQLLSLRVAPPYPNTCNYYSF